MILAGFMCYISNQSLSTPQISRARKPKCREYLQEGEFQCLSWVGKSPHVVGNLHKGESQYLSRKGLFLAHND